ncbi:MAG TPA: protein kinase [Vicinamibacteria bacterium]|nr:protein kinase [Vicinamibacteria bacterium]
MSQEPLGKLGKYEIRKELGKGAMGVVYLAWDPVLEREVGLKVMASTIVSDDELRQRFEREAKAVARLQHANIVTIYDLGTDQNGSPFIAMELLKGTDLERRIRNNPPPFAQRLEIVSHVCRGLAHAHRNGIVHRDIKPANIFVLEGGGVKIMDFGVARWMQSSQTQTGAVLGTADYMSPEQIRGQKVDGRSDIFSVGIILYRLLTNKKPFTGENIQATFYKILTADPPLLILPDGQQVEQLQVIVDRALAKDSEERYLDADQMADDIKEFLRVFEGAISENTLFDTSYDPEALPGPETPSGAGSGRRETLRPGSSGRMARTSPGSTGGGYRTVRGTSVPPTAMGRAGEQTAAAPTGHSVAGRTGITPATRIARPRPAPPQSASGLYVLVAAVVLAGAGGGYWYYTNHRGATPASEAPGSATATPSPEVLNSRFQFAEDLLEKGQIAQAFEVVQNILTIAPDNERALALQAQIQEASAKQAQQRPSTEPSRGGETSAEQQAQTVAADAALAIANGQLAEARDIIARGRELDPSMVRWDQLTQQLQSRTKQIQAQESERQRQGQVSGQLQEATRHVEAGDYDSAIAAYDAALQLDPTNAAATAGKSQVVGLKRQVEMDRQRKEEFEQKTAVAPTRTIVESKTEFTEPGAQEGPKGFESGGVEVKRATAAPTFPADVIIEVNPPNALPGQPYVLRVRVANQGNTPIQVKSIELVSSYGGKTTGKGQQIPPRTQRVNPRATAVLLEVSSTWTEEQNKGMIVATVSLIGGGFLTKSIQW